MAEQDSAADAPHDGRDAEAPAQGEPRAAPDAEGTPEGEGTPKPEGEDVEKPKGPRDYNRAFAALSRREKAFREREQAVAREKAQVAQDLRELATFRHLRQSARSNPKAWLEAAALDRDTTARAWGEPEGGKAESAYDRRLAELEKQIADRDRKFQEAQEQSARMRYVDRISRVIESDPSAYELLRSEGKADDVYELMDRHYREYQEVLPIEKACATLEDVLAEQLTTHATRLRGYKKLAPRLGWSAPEKDHPGEDAPAAPTRKTSTTTLSQRSAPATSPTRRPTPPMDEDQEWAEKVRRFQQG